MRLYSIENINKVFDKPVKVYAETVTGYIPHWATCPAAKSFKKDKGEVNK